ncbi:hypothetical protein Hanom_Chr06g00551881 [Helianthus anomalus]
MHKGFQNQTHFSFCFFCPKLKLHSGKLASIVKDASKQLMCGYVHKQSQLTQSKKTKLIPQHNKNQITCLE